ncbi:MAG: non-canonical purine NTP diphosphatase [Prevotella sp.]
MKIVFATNNAHKLDEIRHILGDKFEVLSLNDINCHDDIPETGETLEENARQKAEYIYNKYHMNVFADDTGLEVEALGGEPGVFSARYAAIKDPTAESHDSEANMTTLLNNLEGTGNRNARFRTVIALILTPHNKSHSSLLTPHSSLFEGIVEGSIIKERRGGEGFGYDPIFQPKGYDKTFAELGNDIKNTISHRARAVAKLAHHLTQSILQ